MKKFKDPELQQAYDYGYNAGYFGAGAVNCHFSIFNKREKTKAWSAGNDAGSKQRERVISKAANQKKKK